MDETENLVGRREVWKWTALVGRWLDCISILALVRLEVQLYQQQRCQVPRAAEQAAVRFGPVNPHMRVTTCVTGGVSVWRKGWVSILM